MSFTFGKYKNKSIEEVFRNDKQYVKWLSKQQWFQINHSELYHNLMDVFDNFIPEINKDRFIVYTDGACPNNGNDNALSSIGVHFSEKNPIIIKDVSEALILNRHSNNYAEMEAIHTALLLIKKNNIDIPIELYTDSSYCKSILCEWYEKWVRNNLLKNKKNISIIEKTYHIYKTFSNINIIHVHSHTNKKDEHSCGNRIADQLARDALKK
jgi:ribonuclease HI